jgi:hypothetical protein
MPQAESILHDNLVKDIPEDLYRTVFCRYRRFAGVNCEKRMQSFALTRVATRVTLVPFLGDGSFFNTIF